MKRRIAWLLALLVAALALPALAAEYTLDEKLYKQVKDGSGLKAAVTFEKTGGAFSVLDTAANAAVNALLPGSELSLRYLRGVGTLKGLEELELLLLCGGQQAADLRYLKDAQFEQLTSSLLGGVRYLDARDGGVLLALLTGQDPVWPPVEGLLLKLNTAESTWQAAAARKLESYTVRLSLWLQPYTRTETVRDTDNRLQTRVTVSVPAPQLKAQIKQLLLDAYADTELLALLAQELDGRQAAAYLQPGMLNGFFQALDSLPIDGNLVSERLVDAQGQILENRLLLPMGGARGVRQVTYAFLADATGGQTTVVVEHLPKNPANAAGATTTLAFAGGPAPGSEEVSYAGTLTLQPEAGTEGFTVAAPEGGAASTAYGFNLLYAPSPEAVDNAAGTSTRDFEFNLLVTPQGDGAPAPQSLRGSLQLQSRLNSRSATYFTGRLTWTDQGSQAQITANVTGNTAPPWNIPAIDPAGATRVDGLSAEQMQGLREQVQTTLQGALTALVAQRLMPAQP